MTPSQPVECAGSGRQSLPPPEACISHAEPFKRDGKELSERGRELQEPPQPPPTLRRMLKVIARISIEKRGQEA